MREMTLLFPILRVNRTDSRRNDETSVHVWRPCGSVGSTLFYCEPLYQQTQLPYARHTRTRELIVCRAMWVHIISIKMSVIIQVRVPKCFCWLWRHDLNIVKYYMYSKGIRNTNSNSKSKSHSNSNSTQQQHQHQHQQQQKLYKSISSQSGRKSVWLSNSFDQA